MDKTLKGGLIILGVGVIFVGLVWWVALRQSNVQFEPLPMVPLTAVPANATLFEIQPLESEARFVIGEILRGQAKTVIGVSPQVTGQLAITWEPTAVTLGQMQVDARTFYTDNEFRDFALHNRILFSQTYPRIGFVATAVSPLPPEVKPGDTVSFSVTGDLTVVETTQPVTWDVTAVLISDGRIEGQATTRLKWTDFNLFIPSARDVAAVDEELGLEIDFVATAVTAPE